MNAQVRESDFASVTLYELPTTEELKRQVEAAGPDATVQQLASLFHLARLCANPLRQRHDDIDLAAFELLPPEPARWEPQEARERWSRQCAAIRAGLGEKSAYEALVAAEDIVDGLAARVDKAAALSLEDLSAKLGVAHFSYFGADGDAFMKLLGALDTDIRALAQKGEPRPLAA